MRQEEFEHILQEQMERLQYILSIKSEEYSTDSEDFLNSFVVAAMLQDTTLPGAVVGMMSKHTVSIFNMALAGRHYPLEMWDEKITDHIVYLILLRATIIEEQKNLTRSNKCSKRLSRIQTSMVNLGQKISSFIFPRQIL